MTIDKSTMPSCAECIHVLEYCGNLSIRRILSLWVYSLKVLRLLWARKLNVILGVLPCNSLGLVLWLYKRMHSSVRLIGDVTDMWPESLPISKISKALLSPCLWFCRWLRNMGVISSDKIICEYNLFAQIIIKADLKEDLKEYPFVVFLNNVEKAEYRNVSISGGYLI